MPTAKRKPSLKQHLPEGPEPTFAVTEIVPGRNYWRLQITDNACPEFWGYAGGPGASNRTEFRYTPPKKGCPFTVRELALAAALRMAEARGWLTTQEFTDGVCSFSAVFVADSRHVFCVWSTDPERAKPVDLVAMPQLAAEKLAETRRQREQTPAVA